MAGGMSGPRGPRGRRRPVAMAPTRTTRAIPTATPRRTAFPVESAARRFIAGSHPSRVASPGRSHAEGTLGRLVDGVGAPRGPEYLGRRVHLDRGPVDLHGEPVHALGSGAELVLPGPVVLRPVAGAFEPLALLAERHPAPPATRADLLGRSRDARPPVAGWEPEPPRPGQLWERRDGRGRLRGGPPRQRPVAGPRAGPARTTPGAAARTQRTGGRRSR